MYRSRDNLELKSIGYRNCVQEATPIWYPRNAK